MLSRCGSPAFHKAFFANPAVDFFQLRFVQPRFRRAVDHVAVVEKETGFVGVPEKFETRYFDLVSRYSVVQIIDHVAAAVEVDQLQVKLVAHAVDVRDQVLIFLLAAIDIARFVNQPVDRSGRLSTQIARPPAADELKGAPTIGRWACICSQMFSEGPPTIIIHAAARGRRPPEKAEKKEGPALGFILSGSISMRGTEEVQRRQLAGRRSQPRADQQQAPKVQTSRPPEGRPIIRKDESRDAADQPSANR